MGVTDMMITEKLVEMLGKLPGVAVELVDSGLYSVTVHAGRLPSGIEYTGLWGNGTTTGNELVYSFTVGDIWEDGEFGVNSLTVAVESDSDGLIYGSDLEDMLSEMLSRATGGLFSCSGSEQGMQNLDRERGVYVHEFSADVDVNFSLLAVSNAA